jgi:hypothetical protein
MLKMLFFMVFCRNMFIWSSLLDMLILTFLSMFANSRRLFMALNRLPVLGFNDSAYFF